MSIDELRELVQAECLRLAKLESPGAIAAELAARGMQGFLEDPNQCPLARGLCDTLMCSTGKLSVLNEEIRFAGHWMVSLRESLWCLRQFVHNFDAGKYPHLV